MCAQKRPGTTRPSGPTRWFLAGLAACLSADAAASAPRTQAVPRLAVSRSAAPRAAVPQSAVLSSAVSEELERLRTEAHKGRIPHAASVDDALSSVQPGTAGRFTSALRDSSRPAGSATHGADAALLALVTGFPRRTLARLAVEELPSSVALQLIDVGFAILLAEPSVDSIMTATLLAGERLVVPRGARGAPQRLQAVLEAALLRDERESRRALERAYIDACRGLEPAFVDALRAVEAPRRLALLVGLLGLRPGSDGLVLNRVHGLALRLGPVLDDVEVRSVRAYLESIAPFERVGAAMAVGALQDRDSLDALVELLDDAEPSVRNAAHDSLRHLSAMTIGPSPDRWRAWLEREDEWWRERGARQLARLGEVERAEAFEILREAAQHRLYRDEIAVAVLPLLADPDTTVVRIALATLEGVRARGVALDLVELLEHPSVQVQRQAAACLRNLTGRRLPADPRSWRQALGH